MARSERRRARVSPGVRRAGRVSGAAWSALLVLLILPASVPGQPAGAATPESAVRGLFDAMEAADSAAARRYLHPDARLHRPVSKGEARALRVSTVAAWLRSIGGAEPGQLREEIWGLEIRRDGRLATAWMHYAFYLDGELHHCGVNAFQLVDTGGRWQAFAISDTSRERDCGGPPRADAGGSPAGGG